MIFNPENPAVRIAVPPGGPANTNQIRMLGFKKTVEVPKRRELVFDLFVNRLGDWWPRDYTWSKRALVHMHAATSPPYSWLPKLPGRLYHGSAW